MNNLFSIFEPSALFSLPLNWASSLLVVLLVVPNFWLSNNNLSNIFKKMIMWVHEEFFSVLTHKSTPGATLMTSSLFLFILLNNFLGLFPYVFTSSAHISFTVALALPLWVGHMSMAWLITPNSMLAHLVPLGTPPLLMPFMVLIELVSNIIRPLTLSVRLAANMVAGHLLLTLLASLSPVSSTPVIVLLMLGLVALGVLETAVSTIQAYVFSTLSTLYLNEVQSPNL